MNLSQSERTLLASLADVLIPSNGKMPSASDAGVANEGVDAVINARPDLLASLRNLLRQSNGRDSVEAVAVLQSEDAAAFGLLGEVVAGAYFMNPSVRQAIGYHGQTPRPIDPRPDYLENDLLESVVRRGLIYRPTPKDRF